jgi:hypothetical protein
MEKSLTVIEQKEVAFYDRALATFVRKRPLRNGMS